MTDERIAVRHDDTGPTPPGRSPTWWQWILLYPALAVAVIPAVPEWAKMVRAWQVDLPVAQFEEGKESQLVLRRNDACTTELETRIGTVEETSIDARVCPATGDVILRMATADKNVVIRGISAAVLAGGDRVQSASVSMIGAAHAATAAPPRRAVMAIPVQSTPVVATICQRWIDDRMMMQRVQTAANRCFDEVFDTLTGQRVSSEPAPCTPSC